MVGKSKKYQFFFKIEENLLSFLLQKIATFHLSSFSKYQQIFTIRSTISHVRENGTAPIFFIRYPHSNLIYKKIHVSSAGLIFFVLTRHQIPAYFESTADLGFPLGHTKKSN